MELHNFRWWHQHFLTHHTLSWIAYSCSSNNEQMCMCSVAFTPSSLSLAQLTKHLYHYAPPLLYGRCPLPSHRNNTHLSIYKIGWGCAIRLSAASSFLHLIWSSDFMAQVQRTFTSSLQMHRTKGGKPHCHLPSVVCKSSIQLLNHQSFEFQDVQCTCFSLYILMTWEDFT